MLKPLFKRPTIHFSGLLFSKAISTFVFILLARLFGPQMFGEFIFYITLLTIFTVFFDFGLNQWYQKTAEGQPPTVIFQKVLSARLITLLLAVLIALFVLVRWTNFSSFYIAIFLITLIPESFVSVVDGYFLETKRPLKISLKTSIKMFIVLVGYAVFHKAFSVPQAIVWLLFGSIVSFAAVFPWTTLKKFKIARLTESIKILRQSAAYAFLIITSYAYARGDSIIIQYRLNSLALGLYGAAYRYLESLSLFPSALGQNLFSHAAKKNGITFLQLKNIVIIMMLFGVLVSITVFSLSHLLIIYILGVKYSAAVPVLQIFAAVLLLFFINSPLSTVVQSSRFIKNFLPFGISNTILNILLNIAIVPIYGIQGAAWVMFTTEVTGLLINLYFIKKIYSV